MAGGPSALNGGASGARFPDADLDRWKRDAGCVQVYSSRVKLTRTGNRLTGLCPFHGDHDPSFTVNRSKTGEYMWGCYPCLSENNGNVYDFVMKFDHVEFPEAVDIVHRALYGRSAASWSETARQVDQTFGELAEKPNYATFPVGQMKPLEDALASSSTAAKWLNSRGIQLETAQAMRLGYRQSLDLAKAKHPGIADKGWLVFPSLDASGTTVLSVKYRSTAQKVFYRKAGMETVLFGMQEIHPGEPVYLVEGEPDQMVMKQAGYQAVSLPSAGITAGPEMKDALMRAGSRFLAGDADGAGEKAMEKLWNELQDQTFMLRWPPGCKDANDTFLKEAGEDVEKFRELVEGLMLEGLANPAPHVTSLVEAMTTNQQTNLQDDPNRLRMPWPKVDRMAVLLPGSVTAVMATQTGLGKSTLVHQICLNAARKYGETILNYQAELSIAEMVTLTGASVLRKHRNHLTGEDLERAKGMIKGVRYYVGSNQNLTTVGPVLDLIESSVRRLGPTIVVLDNLHFICRNEENEVQAQANAMQRVKLMAQKYKLKFIVIGQPRKAKSDQRGKQIHITDWRGGAAAMDDVDTLFIMHREWLKDIDPANPPLDQYDPVTTINRAKGRACGDGPAVTQLLFDGQIATFKEIVPEEFTLD